MKSVSVIIAAYAAENFIGQALESILMQNIPADYKLDVIVGVDGCDKTWNAVSTLKYENVRFIKMERNRGTYVTFNTLMGYTTSDLIVRFDADDIMLQNYLADQINFLNNNQSVHITRTWSIYTDLNKRPIKTELGDGTFTSEKGERRKGSDGQFMMRKEVWEQLGAFNPWPCSADTDFLIRANYSGFVLEEVEQFQYLRRVHENSLTQRKETGVDSNVREGYANIMRKNLKQGMSKEDCIVLGVTGDVESVLP